MSLFPMCNFRSTCSDPLIHLAMHCPSDYTSLSPVKDVSIDSIDRALIKFSYKSFPWKRIKTQKRASTQFLIDSWVAETQMLRALAEQQSLFLAPDKWPQEVERAFGRNPLPTPFELANLVFYGRDLKRKANSHDVVFLRAYSFGVSLEYMASLFMVNEASIIEFMCRAVKTLLESKRFLLWCMHIDLDRFRSLSLSEHDLDKGILYKIKYRKKVFDDPLLYPEEFFSFLTDSPIMLNLCRSGVIRRKSLRVSPPFRVGHKILQDEKDEKREKNGETPSAEE